jgi:2-phosphosulfolactate phosphatase
MYRGEDVVVLTEWGSGGVEALRDQAAVLVIVDVLSFSTAMDVAVSSGAVVDPLPYGDEDAAQAAAERVGAVLAKPRRSSVGQFSLSPQSLMAVAAGTRIMLPSPNGARLSLACGDRPVLTGCLRNAAAVARTARQIADGCPVAVVPAGERWPDGSLRPAIEDPLGARAIIHHLALTCSPEAEVALNVFRGARMDVGRLIRLSVSGRDLIERGFASDVDLAVELEVSICAPLLAGGAYRAV